MVCLKNWAQQAFPNHVAWIHLQTKWDNFEL
jgi:hypothetical protein